MRFGTIAIVGRANVGKSTFLNAALGEPLAIVSPLPQTTREALLGVVSTPEAQLAFLDTPGMHRARSELGRRMNSRAVEAARSADTVLFVSDTDRLIGKRRDLDDPIHPEDRELVTQLRPKAPLIVAINKLDLLHDTARLLPLLEAWTKLRDLVAVMPVSFRRPSDVARVVAELVKTMPEGPAGYPEDTLTDRPTSYFAREYVREAVLTSARGEVPHAVAVTLDEFDEGPTLVRIRATIHVEKLGQRKILVGQGGLMLKEIGTIARKRIEKLVGRKVFLGLFVRVTPRWKSAPRQLAELGYEAPSMGANEGERS